MGLLDSFKSKGVLYLANKEIQEFGKFEELEIDKKNKTIDARLLLIGERESIDINIKNYQVVNFNGKDFLQFDSIKITREWLNAIANKYLRDKLGNLRVEIPSAALMVL